MNRNEVRPAPSRSYLKHKLISATALLLVSAIMLVSTSYAWYVLSTAPEVSNIKTQVGANGALEIALLNKDSWAAMELLDMGDIDESVSDQLDVPAVISNLTWGNLVNLDDASYGLANITLNPARLFIEQTGNETNVEYTVNESTLLKTPRYGEDGRIKELETDKAVAYTFADGTFSNADGYGVRAIGIASNMSVYQQDMQSARTKLTSGANNAKGAAGTVLQATGSDLANIVVSYAVQGKTDGYTETDVANIKKLAEGLQDALDEIESALRYAFAGYITTANAYYMDSGVETPISLDNYQTKLAEITNTDEGMLDLNQLLEMYPGIETVIPGDSTNEVTDGIAEFIEKFYEDQTKVTNAIASCDAKLTDAGTATYEWGDLIEIINPLVIIDSMMVNGQKIDALKDSLKNDDGSVNMSAALALVSGGGLTIAVPSGSGILSEIADFAGEYKAIVPVTVNGKDFGMGEEEMSMDVTMVVSGVDPTHLRDCGTGLLATPVAEVTNSNNSITDFYGYAIDLAFRTNAEESNLLLQTEPQNRVYEGENQAGLQGGGSYMSFNASGNLSATKMVRLMDGIRVVLMDGEQRVLAIAKLDTKLGQNVYKPVTDEDGTETGDYYLEGSTGGYQNSDIIDATAYGKLQKESNVEFDKVTGKVTAKLYLYNFEMTTSKDETGAVRTEGEGENAKILYTGGLTIGSKIDSGVITALTQDVPQKVTALVYLDGSVVNNSTVAASSMYSMTGTLNLQFSSDAALIPASNSQLKTDTSGTVYTEWDSTLYQNGYITDSNGVLYKVDKENYAIYKGSDDKTYAYDRDFAGDDISQAYSELDYTDSTVLTPVTASLTDSNGAALANTLTLAVNETVTVNVVLSDESLKDKVAGSGYGYSKTSLTVAKDETEEGFKYSLTGAAEGDSYFEASLSVEIGGNNYEIKTSRVTIKVTAAS